MKYARPLLLAASSVALFISACSQTPADLTEPTLEPQFGTRGHDSVEDVAYGKAGYLYAVGSWNSDYDVRDSGDYRSDEDESDAFVRRYDRSGNVVWEDFLDVEPAYEGGHHRITAHAVAVDGSGNAIVAWSADYLEYIYNEEYGYGYYEVVATFNYLSKYSTSGSKAWRVNTGGKQVNDLATDSSGNVYATSGGALTKYTTSGTRSWERVNGVTPTGVAVSSTNNIYIVRRDGYVQKYNSSGTQLYAKTTALDGYNATDYKIAAGVSDELYITGSYLYSSEEGDFACDAPTFTNRYYVRLYKLSSSGARQWFKNAATQVESDINYCGADYDGDGWVAEHGLNVATDTAGNAYIATGASNNDAVVTKHNRSGTLLWSKGFGSGAPLDGATSVATYDGSEVFVGAVTYGYLVHRNLGGSDAVMREMNSSGDRVWTR